MAIVMPDDVPVQIAYEQSVSDYEQSVAEILEYGTDPRVPEWLAESTRQFINRAKKIQKLAQAQAVIVSLVPRVQKATSVVTIAKREGEPMSTAWQAIQDRAREAGCTVDEICKRSPELYAKYRKELQAGMYLPVIEKRAEPPVASGAAQTMIMLAQAKIAKGMNILEAYAEVARECPEQYREYRLQSIGRA